MVLEDVSVECGGQNTNFKIKRPVFYRPGLVFSLNKERVVNDMKTIGIL